VIVIGNILLVATAVLSWTFCGLYQLMAPWRSSEMGRNVMTKSLAIAAVTSLGAVRLIVGASLDTPWFQALRIGVFAAVPAAIAWRIIILLKIQRSKRH
jgi:hypothetical protein